MDLLGEKWSEQTNSGGRRATARRPRGCCSKTVTRVTFAEFGTFSVAKERQCDTECSSLFPK